jgi:hypothetical protein
MSARKKSQKFLGDSSSVAFARRMMTDPRLTSIWYAAPSSSGRLIDKRDFAAMLSNGYTLRLETIRPVEGSLAAARFVVFGPDRSVAHLELRYCRKPVPAKLTGGGTFEGFMANKAPRLDVYRHGRRLPGHFGANQ